MTDGELVYKSNDGKALTTSLKIAEVFGKRNADVLRDIRNLHCSPEFRERNFALMVNINKLPQGGAQKSDGEICINIKTLVYQKGVNYIKSLLEKLGYKQR